MSLWREYYVDTTGLIFVVDTGDHARVEDARRNLHRVISDRYMTGAPLLVMANKQDLAGAMAPIEIEERMALDQIRDRTWFVQPACATRVDGLYEGVTWLAAALG